MQSLSSVKNAFRGLKYGTKGFEVGKLLDDGIFNCRKTVSIFSSFSINEQYGCDNKNINNNNNNTSKRARYTGRALDACLRAFNLHGINRVSGRARNANTRYRLRPRSLLGPTTRKRASLSRVASRIVTPLIYDSINKSTPFRFSLSSSLPPPCDSIPRVLLLRCSLSRTLVR